MRALLCLCTLIFAGSVGAQSPLLSRSFSGGTGFANSGEFEKAAKSYRTALMIARNEDMPAEYLVKVHFNLGVCHYRLGRRPEAVSEFERAIKLSRGTYQRAYRALGMVESERKNWPNARRAFLEAVKLRDGDGESWFDLAFVYLAEKDFENAGVAFRRSIENRSVDAALGHNNIGVILAMNNDLAEAEKQFKSALLRSGGRLIEAKKNLEFCRGLRLSRSELVGKADFSFAIRPMQMVAE